MAFYRYHLFICANQRDDGSQCCAMFGARKAGEYLKNKAKEAGIHGPDGVRINRAGCLGRCEEGPAMVIYPDEVWYTYVDNEDLDQIFNDHLVAGKVVERLRLRSG